MQPLRQRRRARLIDAMSLKHAFRQIQSNRHDRHCKRSPSRFGPIGIIAAGRCGGVHIIKLLAGLEASMHVASLFFGSAGAGGRGGGFGPSCRSVAKTFMVSVASVVKWSQRQRAVGSPAALKMGGHRPSTLWRAKGVGFWRGSPRSLT